MKAIIDTAITVAAAYVVYKLSKSFGFFSSTGDTSYLQERYDGSDKVEFITKVNAICSRLGIKSSWLMAVMDFESSINPQAVNPLSNATGLIQFMPSTAQGLGTSTSELYNMSALDQLDYVEKYLKPYRFKMKSFEDTYLAVFYPAAISWSMDKQFSNTVKEYNPIFVKNGSMTKRTIRNELRSRYPNI